MSKDSSNSKRNNTKNTKGKKDNNVDTKKTINKKNTENKTKANKTKNIKEKKEKEFIEAQVEEEFDSDIFDDDLDDLFDDEDEYEEPIIIKKEEKKEKKEKENKKDKVNTNNIKKIEKIAKDKNIKKKNNNSKKLNDFGYFLEKNRNVISAFLIGVIITIIIALIIWPDRIATLKNGEDPVVKVGNKTYTADDLYKQMKDYYSVNQLLDKIDNDILTKMYPETDEMKKEVESTAENYINMYKQYYNYTEEQFLSANGFSNKEAYLKYLTLDNRRKKYEKDYVKKNTSDKEIEKYYNDNVYGDIKCEHVLVEVANDTSSTTSSKNKLKDADAKKLAQEIIDKINDGTSWKDIQKEYKDKVTYEDLGYQAWNSDLEKSFKDALKDMDNNSYSKEPVKTSYGYHVIYRNKQKDTPTLKKVKQTIIDKIIEDKISKDNNLVYKALISLRNEKKINFSDTDMKAKYDSYLKQYK